MQRVQVRSLVGDLRSHMPRGMAKKSETKLNKNCMRETIPKFRVNAIPGKTTYIFYKSLWGYYSHKVSTIYFWILSTDRMKEDFSVNFLYSMAPLGTLYEAVSQEILKQKLDDHVSYKNDFHRWFLKSLQIQDSKRRNAITSISQLLHYSSRDFYSYLMGLNHRK